MRCIATGYALPPYEVHRSSAGSGCSPSVSSTNSSRNEASHMPGTRPRPSITTKKETKSFEGNESLLVSVVCSFQPRRRCFATFKIFGGTSRMTDPIQRFNYYRKLNYIIKWRAHSSAGSNYALPCRENSSIFQRIVEQP